MNDYRPENACWDLHRLACAQAAFDDGPSQTPRLFSHLLYFDSVGSTQTEALGRARQSWLTTPALVLADDQTAGRGRASKPWWSSRGAVTCSLVVDIAGESPGADPRVSLLAGVAVCRATAALVPQSPVGVKWPNDVYLVGRKLAGILVDAIAHPDRPQTRRLVVGIGVNANNSLKSGPAELAAEATSLVDVLGHPVDRTALLLDVCDRLIALVSQPNSLESAPWTPFSLLVGRTVSVRRGTQLLQGRCLEVDRQGRLVLASGGETHRLVSGEIVAIEPKLGSD